MSLAKVSRIVAPAFAMAILISGFGIASCKCEGQSSGQGTEMKMEQPDVPITEQNAEQEAKKLLEELDAL